jgi:hypothetical protein
MLLESMCVKEEAKVSENELLHGVDFRLDGVLNLWFRDSRVGMTICRRCILSGLGQDSRRKREKKVVLLRELQ